MMRIFSALLLAALLISAAVTALPAFAVEAAPDGETLFNNHCAKCHGIGGAGTDKGPPLVHKVYHPNHHGDMSFHLAVRNGVRAHHWRFGDMPRVEGVTGTDTDNIIRYIRRLQKEAGIF